MSSQGSVTRWLGPIQDGDPAAAQQLWERYFPRLVGLARKKLQSSPRRAADEEDVALSAFDSFCRNARRGMFPQLSDRDSLWRLLVVITARKAGHLLRDEGRQKRVGRARAAPPAGGGAGEVTIEQIVSREPSPEFATVVAEECRRLLSLLGHDQLRTVALLKMEGYTNAEIARVLDYTVRSIKRKLQLIRALWEKEMVP
jgi:DNA-directed RNA polymerase specialized sigma24 family protein